MEIINQLLNYDQIWLFLYPITGIALGLSADKIWIWVNKEAHYKDGYKRGLKGRYPLSTANRYVRKGFDVGFKEYKMLKLLNQ